jgi:hypothetical protein
VAAAGGGGSGGGGGGGGAGTGGGGTTTPIVVTPAPVAPTGPVVLRGGAFSYRPIATLRSGQMRVRISCRSALGCKVRARATRNGRQVGAVTKTIAGNSKATLAFRLSKSTRDAVRRNGRVTVKLGLRSYGVNGGGDVVASRTVRIVR